MILLNRSPRFLILISLAFCFLIVRGSLFSQSKPDSGAWEVQSCVFKFKSETALESIIGSGKSCSGFASLSDKKIKLQIDLRDWKTPNNLQTSHLQENYLETQTYPLSLFEGMIQVFEEKTGKGEALGTHNLHGKTKISFLIPFKFRTDGDNLETESEFVVNLNDYGIEIPKLLVLKLNPDIQVKAKVLWRKK